MYGEDVDLSWRLRAQAAFACAICRSSASCIERTRTPGEVKPLQVTGGVQTKLCLRARYGGPMRTVQGITMLVGEMFVPQDFPGGVRGLFAALVRFLARWPHFAFSRVRRDNGFRPHVLGMGLRAAARRRVPSVSLAAREAAAATPLVSILIRTVGRGAWLQQALARSRNQTWPNIEVIVIEDGPPTLAGAGRGVPRRLDIRYSATGERVGRARAGNLALAEARGEWLNFLDDDDVLFADHGEVLVDAVRRAGVKGGYALSWETHTE